MKTILLSTALLAGFALSAEAQGRGADFATLDLNEDGQITLEELQGQAQARFAEADTNGDGGLSAEELAETMRGRMADRAADMLERMDENEDGLLQQTEMRQRGGDRLERMFEHLDANEDGAITEEEFAERKERSRGFGKRH